jgi:hypothetical protein
VRRHGAVRLRESGGVRSREAPEGPLRTTVTRVPPFPPQLDTRGLPADGAGGSLACERQRFLDRRGHPNRGEELLRVEVFLS